MTVEVDDGQALCKAVIQINRDVAVEQEVAVEECAHDGGLQVPQGVKRAFTVHHRLVAGLKSCATTEHANCRGRAARATAAERLAKRDLSQPGSSAVPRLPAWRAERGARCSAAGKAPRPLGEPAPHRTRIPGHA